ncbi:hypothetical protein ACE38V_04385 [Cytobacillus sp. Hz8]|uniref:hypothetical protein n=1 Tax=Cytobacillus sp. Hz8 TaxID=3347168 RepID=UPI0035DFAA55
MNEALINKDEILLMLSELYDQLDELEISMQLKWSAIRVNSLKEQAFQLKKVDKKMKILENQAESFSKTGAEENVSCPNQKNLQLELGF